MFVGKDTTFIVEGGRGQKIYCCEGFSTGSGLSSREGRLEERRAFGNEESVMTSRMLEYAVGQRNWSFGLNVELC